MNKDNEDLTRLSEEEKDRLAWQRAYGYQAPDDEPVPNIDDFEPVPGAPVLRGEEAAAAGRAVLANALGGEDMLERALSGRGHPSLGSTHANGESDKLIMRVGKDLREQLDQLASAQGVSRSELMRTVLTDYVQAKTA